MKIFIYTTTFSPKIGGIGSLATLLAEEFSSLGHEVRVIINVIKEDNIFRLYQLNRGYSAMIYISWLYWCDAHLQLNISLKRLLPLVMRQKWFVSHQCEYVAGPDKSYIRKQLKILIGNIGQPIACSRIRSRSIQ